jgi:tetratricopeptide (TPR) repeat protein
VTAQQEFVRQRLLVHNFDAGHGSLGRRVSDAIANAIDDGADGNELSVVGRNDMLRQIEKSGYNADSVLSASEIREQSRHYRADEYVVGRVLPNGRAMRLEGLLVLSRDSALKQPIATIELPDVDPAAKAFAAEVLHARQQLIPVRRCENALRAGKAHDASAFALAGIKAYPRATIARACLLHAYTAIGQPADSLLRVANELIGLDSTSIYGWEAAALANDEIGNSSAAGRAWNALATLQAHDANVISRVVTALMRDGNPAIAKPIISRAVTDRPDDEHLAGLHWHVLLATEDWANAITVGEALRKLSPTYETQPDYFARMAGAYRNAHQPLRAIAMAAEGVALHPDDPDLYLLYAQLVMGENDAAIPRGLERFPTNGKLFALDAQVKRKRGDRQGALDATRKAVAQDSTLARSYLQLAQAFIDVDQSDSALAVLQTGVKSAADSAIVAQFTLARGNVMYRAASGTKKRADFEMALGYLQLSERLSPSQTAGFLVGSAAFGVAQLAGTELSAAKSCPIATIAQDNLVIAETQLGRNGAAAPDAAKQFLDYAAQLHPYLAQQIKILCPGSAAGAAESSPAASTGQKP